MALRSSTFCVTVFSWMMFFSTSSVRVGRFLRNRARLSCLATFAASDAAKRERVCLTFVTLQDVINVPFNLMPSQWVQTFYTKSNGITVSTMLNLYHYSFYAQKLKHLSTKIIEKKLNTKSTVLINLHATWISWERILTVNFMDLFWYLPPHKPPQKPPDPSL